MSFKIISTGWETGDWFRQTLESILVQDYEDYQVNVIDDASNSLLQGEIAAWCDKRYEDCDFRWMYNMNTERKMAVRNQYEGIRDMDPQDGDIIVFLDLDGDRLAHPGVLSKIKSYYDQGALLTYGGYVPVPDEGTTTPARPYPPEVIQNNSYREFTLRVGTWFNHLRTVKWDVLKHVPEEYFHWHDGTWLQRGTDYAVMLPCLELVAGRYKCVDETILYYNHNQPFPDYKMEPEKPGESHFEAIINLPPLQRLP